MAKRGRPSNAEKALQTAQSQVRTCWQGIQDKQEHENAVAMSLLFDEQQAAIKTALYALEEFKTEWTERLDISTGTARRLDRAFWSMQAAFPDRDITEEGQC